MLRRIKSKIPPEAGVRGHTIPPVGALCLTHKENFIPLKRILDLGLKID